MRSWLAIFSLELKSLVRSKTLAILGLISAIWMLALPYFLQSDGTISGAREIYISFSLGGVFAFLTIGLVASATGSIAGERTAKRLQLTLVRPVYGLTLALGKIAAHMVIGALVLALSGLILFLKVDTAVSCRHVLSPILPSPMEEAERMYEAYMQDPQTPLAVKRAKRGAVIRLLANRAKDHYEVIATNSIAHWKFPFAAGDAAVQMRFTNQYEMRQSVYGEFITDNNRVVISNLTQAVIEVPIGEANGELAFANHGNSAVMLRPRQDLKLLVAADGFTPNLLRTLLQLFSVLTLLVSAGVFLSSGLGRPVALFVAIVLLAVSEMSPSVTEQYPDELETNVIDRAGLMVARTISSLSHPISSADAIGALSRNECVEPREVVRLMMADVVLLPLLFALLSAALLPRKTI